MKKLLSLMLVLCLLPIFSLAEHSIAANYIYQMILKQVDGTDFTRYDDDYEVMFFYPLSKHTYGDAVVRITAYEDGCTINVSYELPIDEAMMPDVLAFFNYLNNSLYVGKMMLLDIDGDWYPAYEVFGAQLLLANHAVAHQHRRLPAEPHPHALGLHAQRRQQPMAHDKRRHRQQAV